MKLKVTKASGPNTYRVVNPATGEVFTVTAKTAAESRKKVMETMSKRGMELVREMGGATNGEIAELVSTIRSIDKSSWEHGGLVPIPLVRDVLGWKRVDFERVAAETQLQGKIDLNTANDWRSASRPKDGIWQSDGDRGKILYYFMVIR